MVFRSTEKKAAEIWESVCFEYLKKGDKFRLFESGGTSVKDKEGNTEFIAMSNPRPCEPKGNFEVDVRI